MELTYKWIALANRHYLMYLNKRLASYGLSGSQYLFILNICRQPGLTQDKLPDIIHINKSNVTRALAHLEKRGFIRREVNPQDKRTALCIFPGGGYAIQAIEKEGSRIAGWAAEHDMVGVVVKYRVSGTGNALGKFPCWTPARL